MQTPIGRCLLALAAITAAATALAGRQAPANTEIYLAPLPHSTASSMPTAAAPAAIDISNGPDYDNQPSFTPDSRAILFTSKRDGKQTDIYRYDIAAKTLAQLTHTPESEYSPLVMPDGKSFSVVRVEADGTQRLWAFDLDGSRPRVLLPNVKPVGYHCWIDATHVALYVLGAGPRDPATLQIANLTTGTSRTLDSNIGHTLLMDPKRHLLTYVKRSAAGAWSIEQVDPTAADAYRVLSGFRDHREDFALDRSGALYAVEGTTIASGGLTTVKDDPQGSSRVDALTSLPVPVLPLGAQPFTNVTRIAISPDGHWIAVVAQPK